MQQVIKHFFERAFNFLGRFKKSSVLENFLVDINNVLVVKLMF